MALGTDQVTITTAATFIPEIWSDEIVAAYKKNLVAANLFKKMSFAGKKGDTVHLPSPTRGSAAIKAANTQVTLIAATEADIAVSIDKHYEYSRLIEDIGRTFNGGSGATYGGAYIGGDGTTAYNSGTPNASALTSAGIRRTVQRLDDADLPMEGRFFLIPPSARNTLMGINEYTAQSFVGEVGAGNTIRNGEIGSLYGIPVFVSSNADTATGAARIALMGHKDAAVLVEQQGVRSQTQYKQEYLGTLYTADTLYGVKELRDGACFALAVPA